MSRAFARHGGNFRSVNFNVLGNLAELVSKLEFNLDITVFVDLYVIHKLNEDFPVERFDVLIFHKCHQRGMFIVNTVCQFCPFRFQPFQHIGKGGGLPLIVGFHVPVVQLVNFPVIPVLIK